GRRDPRRGIGPHLTRLPIEFCFGNAHRSVCSGPAFELITLSAKIASRGDETHMPLERSSAPARSRRKSASTPPTHQATHVEGRQQLIQVVVEDYELPRIGWISFHTLISFIIVRQTERVLEIEHEASSTTIVVKRWTGGRRSCSGGRLHSFGRRVRQLPRSHGC